MFRLPLAVPAVFHQASQLASAAPTGSSAIQSVLLGTPMPDHVAVIVAPIPTGALEAAPSPPPDELAINATFPTVKGALVARRSVLELAKRRISYVPVAKV